MTKIWYNQTGELRDRRKKEEREEENEEGEREEEGEKKEGKNKVSLLFTKYCNWRIEALRKKWDISVHYSFKTTLKLFNNLLLSVSVV